ncbi:MAG TPA: WecB/TagA/CpsF family glycosyltransferase [Cytophagales bacterium]|nr:WecB/TagA/CpsF family glycosyltransferase [Cytophagales bacterium]
MRKINILGVDVDNLTMTETVDLIDSSIKNGKRIHQVAVNAFIFVLLEQDQKVKESIINANLINGDGQSVVWASKLLGSPLKERVAGIDLMGELMKLSHTNNYKVFLFGAEQEVIEKVVDVYSKMFSPNLIAGFRNGYYLDSQEDEIAREIGESGAHFLFVAMGSPKKELFLYKYKDILKTPYIMGVGGSFDVIAGKVKRAPLWMQKAGLEWFYRFLQEPRRMWKRYLVTNSLFTYYVLNSLLRKAFRTID